ncbi:MAG: glycogen/starch/alpha-glucan phosphorylase [Oscillospiraceae bacterium]
MEYQITQKEFEKEIATKISHLFGLNVQDAAYDQYYKAVALIIRDLMGNSWYDVVNSKKQKKQGSKMVYYMCMEFLMGRSLKNNLYNLELESTVRKALESFDVDLDRLYEYEPDAGLGNGGLGRLAACYMDALTANDYRAVGYSILYEYGIFKQKLIDGWQTELPDFWLPGGEAWLSPKKDFSVTVKFGGTLESQWSDGYYSTKLTNYTPVIAVPYDMYVSGKDGASVNVLRLWKSTSPSIDMSLFNQGDYIRAIEQNAMAEVISKVLYPSDNHLEGKSLRLRQQYFLVSASIQDMVQRHLRLHRSIDNIPEQIAIHINDTHPALSIPEMMRIFLDDCGYSWDDSWAIVTKTFAYTNHTVMSEALECWTEELLKQLIPRIYQIIKEIDNRYRAFIWDISHDANRVENMAIISNGIVRMANLCVACCHSVNGVSALHSEILKQDVFNNFYTLSPAKFKNVTNGIAHRRWLCQANPALSTLVTDLIGDGFVHNASELAKLRDFSNNTQVLKKLEEVKRKNKAEFSNYIKESTGISIDPDSIFDVQVKRLHEYKRQHLNAIDILSQYLILKENPSMTFTPRTYIFGAKAAPGYFIAKKIISFIYSLAQLINNDPDINGRMKIVYIEDYNVTAAERLMPCADISEQISLAGTEASGTGNMKLMLNGAITLGTLDGANVEIKEAVGDDNIFIFGMNAQEASRLESSGYNPHNYYVNNNDIHRVIDFMSSGINSQTFPEITSSILNQDPYMVMADFADYHSSRMEIVDAYTDRERWNRMSLFNIAGAGIFSADRAICDYAENIWHTTKIK